MGAEETFALCEKTLRYQDVPSFLQQLEDALRGQEYMDADQFGIRLACQEALDNSHQHGNGNDPLKTIHVQYRVDGQEFFIRITDQGIGFDPASVPDPTKLENLEKPSGRGLLLMRRYMEEVLFVGHVGNVVEMRRRRIIQR